MEVTDSLWRPLKGKAERKRRFRNYSQQSFIRVVQFIVAFYSFGKGPVWVTTHICASLMGFCSLFLPFFLVDTFWAQSCRFLITTCLCSSGWIYWKTNYWSIWVIMCNAVAFVIFSVHHSLQDNYFLWHPHERIWCCCPLMYSLMYSVKASTFVMILTQV